MWIFFKKRLGSTTAKWLPWGEVDNHNVPMFQHTDEDGFQNEIFPNLMLPEVFLSASYSNEMEEDLICPLTLEKICLGKEWQFQKRRVRPQGGAIVFKRPKERILCDEILGLSHRRRSCLPKRTPMAQLFRSEPAEPLGQLVPSAQPKTTEPWEQDASTAQLFWA